MSFTPLVDLVAASTEVVGGSRMIDFLYRVKEYHQWRNNQNKERD